MGTFVGILGALLFFGFLALIAWLLYRRGQIRVQASSEFHRQLLEKFATGGEFSAFLNSSGCQKLLEGLWSKQVNAKERIIGSMRGGVVLAILGLGALALSVRSHGLLVPGALVLALGVGLLLSAAISYRLSKKLGLLKDNEVGIGEQPRA